MEEPTDLLLTYKLVKVHFFSHLYCLLRIYNTNYASK